MRIKENQMLLPFGFSTRFVEGGPFQDAPEQDYFLVKLDPHNHRRADVECDIRDFGVPRDIPALTRALQEAIRAVADRKNVYVGCGAGYGRTGLFLALMAKIMGAPSPVTYVRQNYHPQAVETMEQVFFVQMFEVDNLQWFSIRMEWRAIWADLKYKLRKTS